MIFHEPVSCAFYLGGKFEFRHQLRRLAQRFPLHLERAKQEASRICVEEKCEIWVKTLSNIKSNVKANYRAYVRLMRPLKTISQ